MYLPSCINPEKKETPMNLEIGISKIKGFFVVTIIMPVLLFMSTMSLWAAPETDDWKFEVTPYVFLTTVDIDAMTIHGYSASAKLKLSQLFDFLDFAGFAQFEAWKNNWGILIDSAYMDVGAKGSMTATIGSLTPTFSIDADQKIAYVTLAGSHRFEIKQDSMWVDPIVGLRYGYLKQQGDVSKAPGPLVGEINRMLGGSKDWVEPYIGTRFGVKLSEKWTCLLKGDIGGFGIGDASDLTWNVLGGFDFKPWKSTSIKFGYRFYDIDYETGTGGERFGFDGQLRGPVVGVTFRF